MKNKDINKLIESCPFKPIGYRVILQVEEPEEVTKGGIVLSSKSLENQVKNSEIGYVLAIGEQCYQEIGGPESADLNVGDKILFMKHAGINKKVGDINYRVVNDVDIYSKINEEAELC